MLARGDPKRDRGDSLIRSGNRRIAPISIDKHRNVSEHVSSYKPHYTRLEQVLGHPIDPFLDGYWIRGHESSYPARGLKTRPELKNRHGEGGPAVKHARFTPPPSPLPIAINVLEVEVVGAWRGGTALTFMETLTKTSTEWLVFWATSIVDESLSPSLLPLSSSDLGVLAISSAFSVRNV
jgi:hypothetical protein